MRIFCSLLLVLGLIVSLTAQSFPYELKPAREIALFGLGGGLSLTAHLGDRNLISLDQNTINTLDAGQIVGFDRGAIRQYSPAAADWSNRLLRAGVVSPVIWAGSRPVRRRALIVGTMLAQTMLIQDGITKSTKLLIKRNRPFLYNEEHALHNKLKTDARLSFFSGHTAATASLSFFSAQVFSDVYPDSKWKPVVWGAAALLPAATGYARYRAGKHFPSDILIGYAVGAGIGILVPRLHRKRGDERGWQAVPVGLGNGVGLQLSYCW